MKFKLIFLSILLSACSVKQERVPNNPPNLNNALSLGTEYGKMKITNFSVFLWPKTKTDQELVNTVKNVSQASAEYDRLELLRQSDQSKFDSMDYAPCFVKFEILCQDLNTPEKEQACDEAKLNDEVQNWKYTKVEDVPDDLKDQFNFCRNFSTIKANFQNKIEEEQKLANIQVESIFYLIDPDYAVTRQQVNYKKINKSENSKIILQASQSGKDYIEVRLDGFIDPKMFQSSVDGATTYDISQQMPQAKIYDLSYEHSRHLLKFKVPEVIQGSLTGAYYQFILERNNFGLNPRWGGEIKYYDTKGVMHPGNAKLDGVFQ